MKKLIKNFYHGTSLYNAIDIIKSGYLIPKPGQGNGVFFDGDEDDFNKSLEVLENHVFFTDSFTEAKEYSFEDGVILEFDLSQYILLPDFIDCPNAKNWEESLKECNQITVQGNVNINCISKIHILNEDSNYDLESFKEKFKKFMR